MVSVLLIPSVMHSTAQQRAKICMYMGEKERISFKEGRKKKGSLSHLEHSQTRLPKVVKCTPGLFIGKSTSENLHPKECKNENEENEEYKEGVDGGDGVNQALDKVTHASPVSALTYFRYSSAESRW